MLRRVVPAIALGALLVGLLLSSDPRAATEMDEGKADFFGHGTRGRWRVNALTNCPGATLVTIAAG